MSSNQIYSYSFPTNVRFGAGAINELPGYLKENKLSNPLVVTDPNVADLSFFKKIISELRAAGIGAEVFSDISKNPVKSDVLKGGNAYEDFNSDSIVGIGGGAAMDVSRAIALRINNRRDLFDYDDLQGGDIYVTEPIPHFVTVPTTSGTGSEVGRSAIISEDESKKKRILFHPTLLAKHVFADPELTYELPAFITAATGMDALTHNLEAYLSKNYHPLSSGIALEGVKIIGASIEQATNNSNPQSRADMLIGSLMGAVAFQKGLGVVHSLAHPLSSLVDMHHGLANAICLPYGMEFNIEGQEDKFKDIAYALGIENASGSDVLEYLRELNQKLGLPTKLSEQGVSTDQTDTLAQLAVDDFCHPNNPKPVGLEDFKALYTKAI
ncbi:MAG: iron-containing alcohol dehydrogenase [Flavobacteriales bacterium]|nr:iron-containing alcohol dehydrogenase [Flavobacteriales bacterium]